MNTIWIYYNINKTDKINENGEKLNKKHFLYVFWGIYKINNRILLSTTGLFRNESTLIIYISHFSIQHMVHCQLPIFPTNILFIFQIYTKLFHTLYIIYYMVVYYTFLDMIIATSRDFRLNSKWIQDKFLHLIYLYKHKWCLYMKVYYLHISWPIQGWNGKEYIDDICYSLRCILDNNVFIPMAFLYIGSSFLY